jgi:hypothetical protein
LNGSTQQTLNTIQPGLYSGSVQHLCVSATDEKVIEKGLGDIFFPSAFTPDNVPSYGAVFQ